MTKDEAQSIVVSVWTLQECLGADYTVHVHFKANSNDVAISIHKDWKSIFLHEWQEGDTLDSFLEALNVRVNCIFELES